MKLSDIAQLAGVSVTTASYVINGKAEQQRISSATVERVRAVVELHGLRPTHRLPDCEAGTPARWVSFCRTWKTPVTRGLPSCWNKALVLAATSC